MKEFDKHNFFMLLGLSLVWLYIVWNADHWFANISLTATAFLLYIFVTKIYDERSGFFSSLIFLSTLGVGLGANYAGRGAFAALLVTIIFMLYLWERYWLIYPFLILSIYFFGFWLQFFAIWVIFNHCVLLGRLERLGNMHLIRGLLLVGVFTLPVAFYFHPALDYGLFQEIFAIQSLSVGVKYAIPLGGISVLLWVAIMFSPYFFAFIRGMFQSISDCRNDEWERHVLLHLWGIFGLIGILILGKDYYPLLIGIFPSLAILLGWCIQRLEINFNPLHLSYGPAWDCFLSFMLLAFTWHYFGIWQPALAFQSNLVALLLLILAAVANIIYLKFKDINLFVVIQILAGLMQNAFFHIYFYS